MTIFTNPLEETLEASHPPESCILVIFGATGDLTARKLIPALYNLAADGQLPAHFACVGFARRDKTHDDFREEMEAATSRFSRRKPIDPAIWESFSQSLYYHRSEFDNDQGYEGLKTFLGELDRRHGTKGNRVFYFSTPPSYFTLISAKLSEHKLIYPVTDTKWSRIIIEKPFGHDLASANTLQTKLEQFLEEEQIYRIDHYLGKETVQNLLTFRFSNSIFESIWNYKHIDHVQITVSEDIGIGTRGKFFEEAGILRDIVQNHMMQLLSLVAMEPPVNLHASSIHDEKVKVLEALRPIANNEVIRGQYGSGFINGNAVKGYREEDNVSSESFVETYMAMRLHIDNWRWAGVPFYLRAGKRLPKRATEIAIVFKDAPGAFFKRSYRRNPSNVLVIRIQPDEGISLKMNCKVPGLSSTIQPVKMDFRYGRYFGSEPPEAYERLICDSMSGDATLFARSDEVLASWRLLSPVLEKWKEEPPKDFPNYAAGSWGPDCAENLLMTDHQAWRMI